MRRSAFAAGAAARALPQPGPWAVRWCRGARPSQKIGATGLQQARLTARQLHSWACVETPNPDVRKFEWLLTTAPHAPGDGLLGARGRLLELEGVRDVFVAAAPGASAQLVAPWVAVTRVNGTSWEALAPRVQAVLDDLPQASGTDTGIGPSSAAASATTTTASTGEEAEISEVLLHRVRPSVQADGGDVELLRWDAATGEVVLRLRGACRGCPQSAVTLQESILRTLQHYVPQVRSVAAEEEQEDALAAANPSADISWVHHGQPDAAAIQVLAAAGTPFFSTFAGIKVEGKLLRRVQFLSKLELAGRVPEHIFVSCPECKARRTIEDPQDLMRADKGNASGNAAVVICPSCCVLISP